MFVLEEIVSKKGIEADCQVLFQKCFHFFQSKESDRWKRVNHLSSKRLIHGQSWSRNHKISGINLISSNDRFIFIYTCGDLSSVHTHIHIQVIQINLSEVIIKRLLSFI